MSKSAADGQVPVTGYKGFDKDLRCRGMQFETGRTYAQPGRLSMCSNGFHFCRRLSDCLQYYGGPADRYCEIQAQGRIIDDGNKSVCSRITIVRELSADELRSVLNTGIRNTGMLNTGSHNRGSCNTGNYNDGTSNTGGWNSGNLNTGIANAGNCNTGISNAGDCNTGSYNAGRCNTGSYNTGDDNTGDCNSGESNTGSGNTGSYNTGNYNTGSFNAGTCNSGSYNAGSWNSGRGNAGFFNTVTRKYTMFNRETDVPLADIRFPRFFYEVRVSEWTPVLDRSSCSSWLTDAQKDTEGVLVQSEYKEAWMRAFATARARPDWEEEKQKLLALPNFDFGIFEEITGITRKQIMSGKTAGRKKRTSKEAE